MPITVPLTPHQKTAALIAARQTQTGATIGTNTLTLPDPHAARLFLLALPKGTASTTLARKIQHRLTTH